MSADRPERPGESLDAIFYRVETVRFVYWERFSSAKAAVGVVVAIAILTFVTGLSTMSREELVLEGPLAPAIPEAEIIRFAGVFAAFVLGFAAVLLRRRKRIAWRVVLVVLPLVGLLPLVTLESTHFPLLILVLVALPLLVYNRAQFGESLDLEPLQIAAMSSIVGVLAYGTIGAYALREQFTAIETWSDSIYYVLVTIATVGYGDITPTTTQTKWFSLSVIILGTGAFTAAIGAFVVPAIEKRMANAFGNMTRASLSLLEDHVIILGYSDITASVLDALDGETDVVVVTEEPEVASELDQADVNVLTADPTKPATVEDVGLEFASGVVIGTDDDPRDVLAVIATRKVDPDVRIVAAATEPHNASTLREVGADQVISPTEIGGTLLGQSVLGELDTATVLADLPDDEAGDRAQPTDPPPS